MKIGPVGSELFRADIQTDIKDIIVEFRNSMKAPKKMKPKTKVRKMYQLDANNFTMIFFS